MFEDIYEEEVVEESTLEDLEDILGEDTVEEDEGETIWGGNLSTVKDIIGDCDDCNDSNG